MDAEEAPEVVSGGGRRRAPEWVRPRNTGRGWGGIPDRVFRARAWTTPGHWTTPWTAGAERRPLLGQCLLDETHDVGRQKRLLEQLEL
jgi:hypothetical protein